MLKNAYLDAKIGFDAEETSPLKFGDLAEKSELNSVSNFSTKAIPPAASVRIIQASSRRSSSSLRAC